MSLSGLSLLTKRSEVDVQVAEPSAGGFLAKRSKSRNNFPSWLWSKMVYIKRSGSWAQTPLVLMLDTSFNVQLSCCHLVEHLPLPCRGVKSRFPWCSTLGFFPAVLGETGTESSRGMEGDHERWLAGAGTDWRVCRKGSMSCCVLVERLSCSVPDGAARAWARRAGMGSE